MSDETTWADSHDEYEDREPRGLLLEALSRFGSGPHDAVDLGCGSGIDTLAILERGWSPAPCSSTRDRAACQHEPVHPD